MFSIVNVTYVVDAIQRVRLASDQTKQIVLAALMIGTCREDYAGSNVQTVRQIAGF